MNVIRCPNCRVSEIVHKYNCNKFQIYFCKKCLNGFTYPVPKNLGPYYGKTYWIPEGFLGAFKEKIYALFQIRRKYWILEYLKGGEILDVGSGEGIFGKHFKKNFNVTSLDVPSANIKNPNVLKVNFLNWSTKKRFDVIVFWESLEHTSCPQKYINKAYSLLKPGGYIFIEYPRFDCFEARLFKKYWFHLDPPRHLSHLTPRGLDKLLSREKLKSIRQSGVLAFEYNIAGFVSSIINIFPNRPNDFFKNSKNILFILLLIPLIFISTLLEILFFALGQSPIYLSVSKKINSLALSKS